MYIKSISIIVLFCIFSVCSFASLEKKPTYIPIFSIDDRIHHLVFQSSSKMLDTKLILKDMNFNFDRLNPAEQYLYLMIQANDAQGINQYQQIIDYLSQAKALEPKINQEQLNNFPFINLYKKLAQSYASIGQFKKAYNAKNSFTVKYNVFLKNERNKHIFELEEKYETNRKKNINALLNNQTALKALEISESLNNEIVQRRNIYIVGVLVVIFLLLLIRLLSMNKRTSDLSKEDMLTGVYNRKTLFIYGQNAIKRCIDERIGLCLLAINIDGFKRLNDTHGDYIGDEVLKKIGLLGIESMRARDVFARLEDATFIAILSESSEGEAKAIAQHLKSKFAAFNFNYVGIHQRIEMSVSIVELSESLNNFELLLNTGMNTLYEIKDSGGNNVKVYKQYA